MVTTIVLKVVASYNLWIWHAFFGLPGSLNDINILDRSPAFQELYENQAPKYEYVLNEYEYKIGYYLSDGIYLKWATFGKTIPLAQWPKKKLFAECQESVMKDIDKPLVCYKLDLPLFVTSLILLIKKKSALL